MSPDRTDGLCLGYPCCLSPDFVAAYEGLAVTSLDLLSFSALVYVPTYEHVWVDMHLFAYPCV